WLLLNCGSQLLDRVPALERVPNGSHLGKLLRQGCIEDATESSTPFRLDPRRGPTGLHRTQFRNPNRKSRKREKGKRSETKCVLSRDEVGAAKVIHKL